MRPASEIHSALDLLDRDINQRLLRIAEGSAAMDAEMIASTRNLLIASAVLSWATGGRVDTEEDATAWLVAYLLDDPPRLDNTPPEAN